MLGVADSNIQAPQSFALPQWHSGAVVLAVFLAEQN